jgi:hypothetical protein
VVRPPPVPPFFLHVFFFFFLFNRGWSGHPLRPLGWLGHHQTGRWWPSHPTGGGPDWPVVAKPPQWPKGWPATPYGWIGHPSSFTFFFLKKKFRFKNLKLKKINILISQNGAFWDLLTAVTKSVTAEILL